MNIDRTIHELLEQNQKIAHIWSIEDVQHQDDTLTDDEAWQVLQFIDRQKDCELGITWDTIACSIIAWRADNE